MKQRGIPCHFMRGGTSKGPYFNAADLPDDRAVLSKILAAAVGAGHPLSIDGLGAGNEVTTKVAILSPSEDDWAQVDYLFAQINPESGEVDYRPTCGNILVGVGPAAVEMGLVQPQGDQTAVRIRSVNTGAKTEIIVNTPDGYVEYEGNAVNDGVPGTGAPLLVKMVEVEGSRTSGMFPTGKRRETIDGHDVTLIDVAMPMVIGLAEDFGIAGDETSSELNENEPLFERMEAVRLKAGRLMGLGDVSNSVIPKFGLLSVPRSGGAVSARYFMPWKCHPTIAVTGSICISSCLLVQGTISDTIAEPMKSSPAEILVEHPTGTIPVAVAFEANGDAYRIISGGVTRTARLLMKGDLMIPASIWPEG